MFCDGNEAERGIKLQHQIRESTRDKQATLLGKHLCLTAFSSAIGASKGKVGKMMKDLGENGCMNAAVDLRQLNGKSDKHKCQRDNVDRFVN